MKKRILVFGKAEDSNKTSLHQNENQTNKEIIARLQKEVQKIIEKYGMPDTSKMDKKFYFIDANKYF